MGILRFLAPSKLLMGSLILMALTFCYSWAQIYLRDKTLDFKNIFPINQTLDAKLYFSTSKRDLLDKVIWKNQSIHYLKNNKLSEKFTLTIPQGIAKNTSLGYLTLQIHAVVNKQHIFLRENTNLIHWRRTKDRSTKKLIGGESNVSTNTYSWKPYVYQKYRFDLVYFEFLNPKLGIADVFSLSQYPQVARTALKYDKFFNIPSEERLLNTTLDHNTTLTLEINMPHNFWWQIKYNYDIAWLQMLDILGDDISHMLKYSMNKIKRIILETPLYILVFTAVCTILHSIFQYMAFEHDIKFWAKRKNFHGVSMGTVLNNFLSDLIILLYSIDTDTGNFLRFTYTIQCFTGFWKLSKLVDFSFKPPFISIKAAYRGKENDADRTGLKYCYIVVTPIIIGYCIYELFTQEFTNIKSYIIHSLAAAIYSYGFLGMIPQLYVNYKLKTVAGMSKAAFIYKSLNTFIDDIYTFVEKMPLMMKIACFRDDIIFFVWLYQCMIYRTDPTRINEFNMQQKEEEEENSENEIQEEQKEVKTNDESHEGQEKDRENEEKHEEGKIE
ncbi:cisplatin, putative [Trichomonas vaginalis G3]|uniref:Cisplatin, putative n=1 Tax=Trichomonas vaginalis (strain ATCC PRA-98 / G3) TaxID=412133 RepID=A2F6I7_TRIV3|nr:apoptotic process [Trichomonas vaginalis G3]EAX99485.1 cisplatin, putative [Trichomonas vaginalis G3]KAI5538690.1 apoptotic process [Trichomonas vaginalis G3]|eukprot:XP_001312415.1 cisplatin [Trichomonas vaginalis G3]